QLAAMGWTLTRTAYGALATYEDREIVFTAWPVDMIGVQSIQTTERIRAAGAPVSSLETQPRPVVGSSSGAAAAGSTQQHAYGQFRETSNPGNYTGSRIYGGAGGV
ncbi:MAG TPA: hypothetical protein VNR18_00735, partial [Hyphomicrobiales bacterium]|nr:hypothetical protein [Hyphomicrobiales bacterium]